MAHVVAVRLLAVGAPRGTLQERAVLEHEVGVDQPVGAAAQVVLDLERSRELSGRLHHLAELAVVLELLEHRAQAHAVEGEGIGHPHHHDRAAATPPGVVRRGLDAADVLGRIPEPGRDHHADVALALHDRAEIRALGERSLQGVDGDRAQKRGGTNGLTTGSGGGTGSRRAQEGLLGTLAAGAVRRAKDTSIKGFWQDGDPRVCYTSDT